MNNSEYERLLEQAPQLKASGLEEGFRLLAEFNDVVLAGRTTRHGFQFVTWARDFDKKGVCWGHYFEEDFESAKEDFATRAGLVPPDRLLSSGQLVEVYRAIHETLESDYPMTEEREQLLKDTAAQIERAVPNLDKLVQKSNERELIQGQAEYPGMTQHF